jgi:multidrug efflux system outer membrane protein
VKAGREVARLARVRFSEGEGRYLKVFEAERFDFASRCELAVARANQRLAVIGTCKALGGGWKIGAEADCDCGGADGVPNSRFVKQLRGRP